MAIDERNSPVVNNLFDLLDQADAVAAAICDNIAEGSDLLPPDVTARMRGRLSSIEKFINNAGQSEALPRLPVGHRIPTNLDRASR